MRKSLSKTPAPPKDRIHGSKVNAEGSASSEKSAKTIKLSSDIVLALTKKLKEFKETNDTKKVSLNDLKAVYRRGLGAYSSTHRPTISGGKPNTRNAWAMARVNKFLEKASGKKVKDAYVQDDDLLKYNNGGVLIPPQGTLYTKDKKNKLEYYKKGNDYAFKVYDVENNPVENYTRNQYKKRSNDEALMNYNQFINYLYTELYIDDKYAEGGEVDDHKETYKKWKSLVNMSYSELEKFYNSADGKKAGLSSSEAKEQGISSGRESARWILKMKKTPVSKWTDTMWKWTNKQISFISRMSGNKGDLYDDKGNKTRKHTSLLIWGHNPEKESIKYEDGGATSKKSAIHIILEEVKPYQDEITEKWVQSAKEKGEIELKDWMIEDMRFSLIMDLVKAIGNYLEPTDVVKNLSFSTDKKGITMSCIIERDGSEYPFSTEMIYAGGYNIQKLHLRYIVHTKLPHKRTNAEYDKLNEQYKKMTKAQKIRQEIEYFRNEIGKYHKKYEEAKKNSMLSDDEVEKLSRQNDTDKRWELNDVTWDEIVKRGADKNFNYDKNEFLNSQKDWIKNTLENWRSIYANVRRQELTINSLQKQIDKLNKKLSELGYDKYEEGGEFKSHKSIEQIAKEKNVPLSYAKEQLSKGMNVESEHSDSKQVQETIALQHLDEMIDYYKKLEKMENKSGGFLVGEKNGEVVAHNQGDLGGVLVGKRHSEGGIKGMNQSTGQPIEVESGEVQLSRKAVNSDKKHEFNGKMMTNKEILSELNQYGGGVAFKDGGNIENNIDSTDLKNEGAGKPIEYKGGEVILTRGAVSNPKKYDFNGKQMTTREIASQINEEAGGVSFESGGELTHHTTLKNTFFPAHIQEEFKAVETNGDVIEEVQSDNNEHKMYLIKASELNHPESLPILEVGSSIYSVESNGSLDEWEIEYFTDDSVVLRHKPKHKLHNSFENKIISFDELVQMFRDGHIKIKNINNDRELGLVLEIVKKKINTISNFKDGGLVFTENESEDERVMKEQFGNLKI